MQVDEKQLSQFKLFKNFNLFLFTRNKEGKALLLLFNQGNAFSHLKGHVKSDPCVIYSMINQLVKQTGGLLAARNFIYLIEDSTKQIDKNFLIHQADMSDIKVGKRVTPVFEDFCKQFFNTPYIFQDKSKCATYFLEIPLLSLEKVHQAAKEINLDLDLQYFSIEEICSQQNKQVDPNLRRLLLHNKKLRSYIANFIENKTPIQPSRNVIFLGCNTHQSFLLPSMYAAFFKKHGEAWNFYHAPTGLLPTEDDIKAASYVIIPGSCASAYGNHEWLPEVFKLIKLIREKYTHIKLLGICFGSQAIAQALGGNVEKMAGGFIEGGETLEFISEFYKLPYIQKLKLNQNKKIVISQIHQDHITKLPTGAMHLSSSKSCNVESYSIGNNILGFQGHPDYSETYQASLNFRLYQPSLSSYEEWEKDYIRAKYPERLTQKETLRVCYSFLKHKQNF